MRLVVAAVGTALAIRVVRSRHRRFLHPSGRSFGGAVALNAALLTPGHHRATIRVSKGIGTRGSRLDIRGLAVRIHLPGHDLDLLFSTSGRGRLTRHLPLLRRSFDATYGTITAYETGSGVKVNLTARPDPDGPALGRSLDDLAEGDRVVLEVGHGAGARTFAWVTLGPALSGDADAALGFNPVLNSSQVLHPTGLIHGVRTFAYQLSQRWRGAVDGAGRTRFLPGRPAR
jgi:hypothetical protein